MKLWDSTAPHVAIAVSGALSIPMTGCTRCVLKCAATRLPSMVRPQPGGESLSPVLLVVDSPQVHPNTVTWMIEKIRRYHKGTIVIDYAIRQEVPREKARDTYYKKCLHHLKQTFQDVKPRVVIACDVAASNAVAGFSVPTSTNVGLWSTWDGPWGTVTFSFVGNPAQGRQAPSTYGRDIEAGVHLAFQNLQPPGILKSLQAIRLTPEMVPAFEFWMNAQAEVHFDLETYGVAFTPDHAVDAIAFASARSEFVFVALTNDMEQPEVAAAIKAALTTGPPKSAWNAVFDFVNVFAAWGYKVYPSAGDALALFKLQDVNRAGKLQNASMHIGVAGHKDEAKAVVDAETKRIRKEMKDAGVDTKRGNPAAYAYRAIEEHIVVPYVAMDAWTSAAIADHTMSTLDPALVRTWDRLVRGATDTLVNMECRGWRIDMGRYAATKEILNGKMQEVEERLAASPLGKAGFDHTKPADVRAYLEKTGVTTGVLTATGAMSVGKAALERLQHLEAVQPLLEYRQLAKLMQAYVDGMPYFVRADGRVHASYRLSGARSGRLSTCVAGWTPVRTARGDIPVRDVVVGDLVWTHKKRWRRVVNQWLVGTEQAFDVHLSNGNVLTCTGSHRLLSVDGTWMRTEDIAHEYFQELGGRPGQRRDGCAAVPGLGADAEPVPDRRSAGHELPQRDGGCAHPPQGGVEGAAQPALVGSQDGGQEPHDRQDWLQERPVDWYRGGAQHPSDEGVLVRQPGGWQQDHAASTGHAGVLGVPHSRLDGCAPHRRGPSEQLHRQPGPANSGRALECPRLAAEGVDYVCYTSVHRSSSCEVYDLTVDDDESYLTLGVWSHNSGPSTHQIPGRSELGKLVKSWFVPDPGYVLVAADYKTLEVVVTANWSMDPVLVETLSSGQDIHLQTAMRIGQSAWGLSPEEVKARHEKGITMYRSAAKSTVFGILYGQGVKALAEQIHASYNQAKAIVEGFYLAHPTLTAKIAETKRNAVSSGESWAFWNGEPARVRKLRDTGFPAEDGRRGKDERVSINNPIQSAASDYCLASVVTLDQRWVRDCVDRHVLGTVHDSIIAQCRPHDVYAMVGEMQRVMTGHPTYPLPLVVDFEVGYAWGSMKKYDPEVTYAAA